MLSSVEIGIQAFKERRYDEAVALFEEILRVQPDNHKLIYLLAQGYQALGRMTEARRTFSAVAQAAEPRLAEMARQAIAAMGDQGLETVTVPVADVPPDQYCPTCGELIPPERSAAPWCACGWGKRSDGQRLYLAHLMAFCQAKKLIVELKLRGDLFAIANDVRLKHMSDQMTKVDPRVVFRVDRGVPYLVPEDLDAVVPKVDDRAQFRLRKGGQEIGAGKLLNWVDLRQMILEVVGDPRVMPDGSLAATLVAYGEFAESLVRGAEQEAGRGGLGTALVQSGSCSVQELLAGALGSTRVVTPLHHQGNQIGRLLLDAGALSEDVLKRALVSQVKEPRPLVDLLKSQVSATALAQAMAKLQKLPDQGPERDRLGEILNEMGVLSRTDLAHALEERRRRNKLFGKILLELGMVSAASLSEGLLRQRLKREARMAGTVRLGAILIELRYATPKTIAMALVQQIQQPRPIGELLIRAEVCTPEQLVTAIALQEERLDAMVQERLPAELEALRAEEAPETDESAPKRHELADDVAPDEDEEEDAPKRGKYLLGLMIAGGIALVYGAGQGARLVWEAYHPVMPEPPMAKALPKTAAKTPVETFSTVSAKNKIDVDMDQVVKRIEKGEADPLGGEYMAAYRKKPGGIRPEQLATMVPGAPKPPGAPHSELAHPVADDNAGDSPSLEPINVQKTLGTSEQVVKGDRMVASGRPAEAVKAYQAALADTPSDPELLTKLGEAQLKAGRIMDSEETLTRATQLAPRDPQAQADLGAARQARGDAAGAVIAFSKAAKADPKNSLYQNKLGLSLKAAGQVNEAAHAFTAAVNLDPTNPNSRYNLGLLTAKQDPKGARDHFSRAVKGFSGLVESRMAYAEALQAQGDLPGALQGYRGALKANTLLAETYLSLGKLSVLEHDVTDAKNQFMAAKATYRTNAIAHARIGDALQSLNRTQEARVEWIMATQIAPFYSPPFYELGVMAKAQGRTKEARHFLEGAIAADPTGPLVKESRRELKQLGTGAAR